MGALAIEGFEHYLGRDGSGGVRRGIALAPALAAHAIVEQSKEVELLKQRRKAREEAAAAALAGKGNHPRGDEPKTGGGGGGANK